MVKETILKLRNRRELEALDLQLDLLQLITTINMCNAAMVGGRGLEDLLELTAPPVASSSNKEGQEIITSSNAVLGNKGKVVEVVVVVPIQISFKLHSG